ncbi:MAG: putative selenium-dependent hydroxylase accessory protein YqeC, partial [Acidobacteria bacterium]|nr:putative selenium-dependent hydroxylase accessory protein YqeC [Acidobacteriota bacterium]
MVAPAVGESLTDRLGLGERDLVSFVRAGGKTTLMLKLGRELADAGHRVVITTTTRMSTDEVESPVVDPGGAVEANLERGGVVYVVHRGAESKMTGPSPAEVNAMFSSTSADYILVEADGARGRSLKAPSQFEPVIPSASTVVVIVTGIDAIGRSIATACHRPERVAAILGRPLTYHLGARDVARVLTSAA